MPKDVNEMTDEELNKALAGEEVAEEQQEQKPDEEIKTEEVVEQSPTSEDEEEAKGEPIPSEEEKSKGEPNNDKAFNGIRKELTHERERRRQAEIELQELRARLIEKKEEPKAKEQEFGYEDDDVLPAKELKSVLARQRELEERIARQEQEFLTREHKAKVSFIEKCEQDARAKYSKDVVGEYDYDTVYKAIEPLLNRDIELKRYILNSENPAEEAYRIGLSRVADPIKLLTERMKPSVKTAKPAPKTIGNVPSAGGARAELDIDNLSDDEISKLSDEQLDKLMRK